MIGIPKEITDLIKLIPEGLHILRSLNREIVGIHMRLEQIHKLLELRDEALMRPVNPSAPTPKPWGIPGATAR